MLGSKWLRNGESKSSVPAKLGRYTGEIASGQGNEPAYSNLTIDEFGE
jgi:hypothetical protein